MFRKLESSKRNTVVIVITAFIAILYVLFVKIYDKSAYEKYFTSYGKAISITTDEIMGTKSMSTSVLYLYKVRGVVYQGAFTTNVGDEKLVRFPNRKYLVIYSKKNPAYHVFIPREVDKEELDKINISSEKLRKEFTILNKAKVVKRAR